MLHNRNNCATARLGRAPRLLSAATAAAAARRFSRLLLYSVLQVVRADAKDIIFDNASRKKMQDGINKVADAVQVTLGPRGERFTRYGAEQPLLPSWPSFCLQCRVCCRRGCSRAAACSTCAQSSQSEQPWIHRRWAVLLEGLARQHKHGGGWHSFGSPLCWLYICLAAELCDV